MKTRVELAAEVNIAERALSAANAELSAFDQAPENNIFSTVDDAAKKLYGVLEDRASNDCEGSNNCGNDEYRQEFLVGGEKYVATLKVDYNRHDKTYYYIDETHFEITKV